MSQPTSTVKFPDSYVVYRIDMHCNHLYCGVRVNGFKIIDNFGSFNGFMQTSFNFNEFIENGNNNTITLDVDSWNWLDEQKEHLSLEEKAKFSYPDASSRVKITAKAVENGKASEEVVAILSVKLDENGQLMIDPETYAHDYPASPNRSISLVQSDFPHLFTPNLHSLSRSLHAKGVANWSWVNAPKYKDIPNNRQLLESAYFEFWKALNSKNLIKIRELLDISLYEITLGVIFKETSLLNEFIDVNFKAYGYPDSITKELEILPFDPKKFRVIELAKGKVVHLEYKEKVSFSYSPLLYKIDGQIQGSTHYFAFIGGKFRIVR